MTTKSETTHQRLASLSDIRALMLEESFKDVDVTAAHFQRRSCRSVLSVHNNADRSTGTENSCVSSPKRLTKSASMSKLKSLSTRRFTLTESEFDPWADASPVLPIKDHLSANLRKECQRAIRFLRKLQQPQFSRTIVSTDPIMPPTALKFSKGIAFLRQQKAGLVTSWTWGSGFVISRIGPGIWSAPCFLSEKFLSCGLTCGYRTVDTCYAIPTNAGMAHFKVDSINSAFDLGLTLGYDPMQGEAPVAVVQSADRTTGRYALSSAEKPKVFHVSDGAILDLSWRFGMHLIDDKIHRQLYGENVTSSDILEGKVQIPEEFKPFYDMLFKLAAVGDVVKPTVSMFEVEKERNKLKSQHSLHRATSLSYPKRHNKRRSGTDSNGSSSNSIEYVAGSSMNDSAQNGNSFQNSVGSEFSTMSVLSGGDGGDGVETSSFKLFGDIDLLDLDLDAVAEDILVEEDDEQEGAEIKQDK
jgi:lipid-binding SYLF domain-containing protein